MPDKPNKPNIANNVVIGAAVQPGPGGSITARQAGGLRDMMLPISPSQVPVAKALQNMAKAINVAFESDFLENELEAVYKGAKVTKGTVRIMHGDYIGLGDGFLASIGKAGKSIQLTFHGPDPASPKGKEAYEKLGARPFRGLLNFIGRKLDFLQEFEDQVPTYVEQLFDRLEAANMISGWDRDEWDIKTTVVGLDVIIAPKVGMDEAK